MHREILKAQFGTPIPNIISTTGMKSITDALGPKLINPIVDLEKMKTNAPRSNRNTKRTSKAFGNIGVNELNNKYGNIFGAVGSSVNLLNDSIVGNEATGATAQTLNTITDTGSKIASQFNPLGGMANSIGKFAGNLIGGTKDRVEGSGSAAISAVSTGLSFLGPVGMAAGTVLNLINGIGGKRVNKLADKTDQIASGYSGTASDIKQDITKYSGKKAGLFDFGFARKGNAAIKEAQRLQDLTTGITEEGKLRKSNTAGDTYFSQNQNKYSGTTPQLLLSKKGMKFPELDDARKLISSWSIKSTETPTELQKFQLGGKMNLIPEGALHARKHNLEEKVPELEGQITNKGIPVVVQGEGRVIQQAEIEKEEVIFRKEFTDELERLYKLYQEDSSSEVAIEAGKLICYELLKNTDDRSGLIKSVK